MTSTTASFKTSVLPPPAQLTAYLKSLVQTDPYNRFCVECHHAHSTHAVLALGIFCCKECAKMIQSTLREQAGILSRVKEVLAEWWDDMQLKAMTAE